MRHIPTMLVTGRNEVLAKVIFLHLSVILFTGGGLSNFSGGEVPPNLGGCLQFFGGILQILGGSLQFFGGGSGSSKFSGRVSNFLGGGSPIFQGGVGLPPNFRNMVNIRPVRILLECILVFRIVLCEHVQKIQHHNSLKKTTFCL